MEQKDIVRRNCQLLLEKKEITIYRLSKIMGTSHQGLYRMIHGKGDISNKSIKKIAGGLGVDFQELLKPIAEDSSGQ